MGEIFTVRRMKSARDIANQSGRIRKRLLAQFDMTRGTYKNTPEGQQAAARDRRVTAAENRYIANIAVRQGARRGSTDERTANHFVLFNRNADYDRRYGRSTYAR